MVRARYDSDKRYSEKRRSHPDQKFLQSRLWRDHIRPKHLRDNPLCEGCGEAGLKVPADQVDHIVVPNGDPALQRAPGNLQSLCASCHSQKTHGHKGHGRQFLTDIGADRYPIDPRHPACR
jgi:5-methylcytosine-specific restriction protein A